MSRVVPVNQTELFASKIKKAKEEGSSWVTVGHWRHKICPIPENYSFDGMAGLLLIRHRGKIKLVNFTTKDAFPRLKIHLGSSIFYIPQKDVMALVIETHDEGY